VKTKRFSGLKLSAPDRSELARMQRSRKPLKVRIWRRVRVLLLLDGGHTVRGTAIAVGGYQSIGALGVIELTAPGRAVRVNEGLRRLRVSPKARQYFALHATLDHQHSTAWKREVLRPLVAADPRCARPIAEGALLQLNAGARCFARYRKYLWD